MCSQKPYWLSYPSSSSSSRVWELFFRIPIRINFVVPSLGFLLSFCQEFFVQPLSDSCCKVRGCRVSRKNYVPACSRSETAGHAWCFNIFRQLVPCILFRGRYDSTNWAAVKPHHMVIVGRPWAGSCVTVVIRDGYRAGINPCPRRWNKGRIGKSASDVSLQTGMQKCKEKGWNAGGYVGVWGTSDYII